LGFKIVITAPGKNAVKQAAGTMHPFRDRHSNNEPIYENKFSEKFMKK